MHPAATLLLCSFLLPSVIPIKISPQLPLRVFAVQVLVTTEQLFGRHARYDVVHGSIQTFHLREFSSELFDEPPALPTVLSLPALEFKECLKILKLSIPITAAFGFLSRFGAGRYCGMSIGFGV
jgi:hypothetical protein